MKDALTGFDHHPHTRIVFGHDPVDRLGEFASQYSAGRVLLVTDRHIVEAGHVDRARSVLEAAGIDVVCFDQVRENPTTVDVDACHKVAEHAQIDLIVGLGGGSSMDTAKGCNFLLTNGGQMQDYWGVGMAREPMLPMIAIPTTAGTGSECQSFALIADENTHQKMACGDAKAAPRIAVLDPNLTLTQPRFVTVCTGIDALTHALESAVTKPRNALSQMYSREALRLIIGNFSKVISVEGAGDLQARGAMLLGASLAGVAIENSMLGAAHSAANPLTANFDIVHGHAVGLMLPHVIRFNSEQAHTQRLYAQLAKDIQLVAHDEDDDEAVGALVRRIEREIGPSNLALTLADAGVDRSAIDDLAKQAARQWTAQFNPRPAKVEDFVELYQSAV